MPKKPNKPCRHQGCNKLIDPKEMYCEEHKPLHPEAKRSRPSSSSRGYGSKWRKESKRFLATHPFCERCKKDGRLVPATVVDHIVPHRGDRLLFWNYSNWQALCKCCHDKKTMQEDKSPEYHY